LPALFEVCDRTGVCKLQLTWQAGIKLLTLKEPGVLTFVSMIIWFILAYTISCLIAVNYEFFAEQL